MSITKENKKNLINEFSKNEKDTGSASVQIAILTERINTITDHLKENRKDHSARRGLIAMVSRIRKLLDYINKHSNEDYMAIIKKLNIRK